MITSTKKKTSDILKFSGHSTKYLEVMVNDNILLCKIYSTSNIEQFLIRTT